ncbi:MAG: N-acetyl-gamma-glutamyl-phosphate reductase [Verrucomicrobia bacterium]|nr:N-acetyl-gamma-glutamyl-phosphate reductase [Verrucomicrobiota bacterium]MCF7707739.1 N-acetyl-gamma-glutamyl-phosphate reductase [Verrucomicrobiota bacterium]
MSEMNNKDKVPVAIVGASGYSGEELTKLLLSHPNAEVTALTSRKYAGKKLVEVFPQLTHFPQARDLDFIEPNPELVAKLADVAFLALPHGVAADIAMPLLDLNTKIIDLSADFRLKDANVYREFYGREHPAPRLLEESVYGMPEVRREELRNARFVASPGCYPTSILIPVIPLLRAGLIKNEGIIADSLSGITGAGRKVDEKFMFVECNENTKAYGLVKHRHLSEVEQELSFAAGTKIVAQFTPHLIPVNRGILTTLYLNPETDVRAEDSAVDFEKELRAAFQAAYPNEPFVRILENDALPAIKNVVGTNVIEFAWRVDPRTGRMLMVSAIDNLVKGAGGQAVQCFNVMCGFEETAGLVR